MREEGAKKEERRRTRWRKQGEFGGSGNGCIEHGKNQLNEARRTAHRSTEDKLSTARETGATERGERAQRGAGTAQRSREKFNAARETGATKSGKGGIRRRGIDEGEGLRARRVSERENRRPSKRRIDRMMD
jgi:hypothetical protein